MLEAAIDLGASADALRSRIANGDVLTATVLPPQGGQDLVEILGYRVSADLPPQVRPGETLLLQVTGFSGTQILVRNLGTADAQNQPPPAQNVPQPARTPPVSPPREVFVAATVRPPTAAPPQNAAPQNASPQNASPAPALLRSVEARIAASQAAKAPQTPSAVQQPAPRSLPVPARIPAVDAVQRAVQTIGDFLRAARLPDTPVTRMAATIAPRAPERLPSVLQRLEAALPPKSEDARVSTLRTLIAFTSRLNPSNSETLRAQVSAYVSNVVEGVEAKVAQLLQAHQQAKAARPPATTDPAQPRIVESVVRDTVAQARVAERSAAISHDLKALVLSLLRDPPPSRTVAMTQALSETLVTLTGTQIHTLTSTQQNPGSVSFTLPVYYHEGGKPAQIRICADAQGSGAKLDADNFHVAFVLDTAHLGMVAIDLQTSGRTVKVDVKTENDASASRFSQTLGWLRTRLEDLRYRVASAAAAAVPAAPHSANALDVRHSPVSAHAVDLQA